jgi:hypothetical protein
MSDNCFFCLGNSKPLSLGTGLLVPYMLGLDIVSFPHSMSLCFYIFFTIKKKWQNFFLLLIVF